MFVPDHINKATQFILSSHFQMTTKLTVYFLPTSQNNSTSVEQSGKLLKFADEATFIGLLLDRDQSAYKQKVEVLIHWCRQNHVEFHLVNTMEVTSHTRKETSGLVSTATGRAQATSSSTKMCITVYR